MKYKPDPMLHHLKKLTERAEKLADEQFKVQYWKPEGEMGMAQYSVELAKKLDIEATRHYHEVSNLNMALRLGVIDYVTFKRILEEVTEV